MQQAYSDFNLEEGGNVTSENSTRAIKEMGMEKNNEEVSK